jgi:plasmid replication initiation protein
MNQPRRSRTYLEGITYELREHAKAYGARWDATRKLWYVLGEAPEALAQYVNTEARSVKDALDLALEGLGQAKTMDRSSGPASAPAPRRTLRQAPIGDSQTDFFVPSIHDIASKENRSTMDVAIFRLSKKDSRAGAVIRYELADGHIEVKSGPDGMASVWDYDIVLMAISHLTDAMNKYRAGIGEKPGRHFRPHVSEILKFSRKGDGGRQSEAIEAALDRLKSTTIKIVRESYNGKGRPLRYVEAEGLISGYKVLSFTDQKKIAGVEIELPNWIYKQIAEAKKPDVLTVHPDYFLIDSGIGRFLYRLARQAAGKGQARWYFSTVYERSGSTSAFKEFCRMIRQIAEADDLPEYLITEEKGQDGPMLIMTHREAARAAVTGQIVAAAPDDDAAADSPGV